MQKKYQLINNTLGWITFAIAAIVYCMTIEPTASFWDCPEFITTGYRLEVGHPPGAPFFMLTANLFSHFASDETQVAMMVNIMSALLSAITILFLFWSITHLARKLVVKDWEDMTLAKIVAIMGSGLVGALIYTFSDTFWFSAVEGEVYAYSSAFTAIVFWLILKWEDHADEPGSDRWLVLIMYMTGLSIGVHLLNLLCIPAIVLVFCYRKFPNIELKGSLLALCISFVLVAAVLYGVVPGIITVGGWFELFFVNTLGMPFNSGEIVYIFLLVASVCWAIWETYNQRHSKRENIAFLTAFGMLGVPFYGYGWSAFFVGVVILGVLWFILNYKRSVEGKLLPLISSRIKNTALLCMLMLMIGYSSYAVIVIRSSSNPPMDQNSPEDIFTLGNYLARDQYGDSPLVYGPAYTSQVKLDVQGNVCVPSKTLKAPIWQRKEKASPDEKDSYFVVDHKRQYNYAQNMLFPRMHDAAHASHYEAWMGGVDGSQVAYDRCGETIMVKVPSQLENIRFFLSYQCNFMYWRYFMWNFAGRQNDIQGNGELEHGNWLSGFSWLDNARLGNQDLLPDSLKENPGRNVYYMLPLILGLFGLFWQAYRGQRGIRQFWVVFFLFFMTGLAIVIYLNQTPSQPRERDYAYAGSFYAYAIWCGLGVVAIIDLLKKFFARFLKGVKVNALALATVCSLLCLLVPVQMASQNWDDHDRSGRYACRDFGQNYLMTLQDEGNPIIFTNGDNDTFPLWYSQDVEGFRTDARVCNLSYLQTDWYIDQMRRPAYDSPALPISWSRLDYCSGTNEMVEIRPEFKQQVLDFYAEDPKNAVKQFGEEPFELKNVLENWVRNPIDSDYSMIPTDTLYLTIDKEAVKRSGMMIQGDSIPDKMVITLEGRRALYKDDLMMLEIIANTNWERPVYVASTVGPDNYMNLGDNFIQEGLAFRITPFTTNKEGMKNFDTEKTYNNVMNRYRYGNVADPKVYLDPTVMRMCNTHQSIFGTLVIRLLAEGEKEKALKALKKCEEVLPFAKIRPNYFFGGNEIAKAYALLGKKAEALKVLKYMWDDAEQHVIWYLHLDDNQFYLSQRETLREIYIMHNMIEVFEMVDKRLAEKCNNLVEKYSDLYADRGGQF